jgi:PAS domain S-box-containing protein
MHTHRILIVEDEAVIAADIQYQLRGLGYRVVGIVDTGEGAVEKAGSLLPDLILMDIRLRDKMDGIEAAKQIRERYAIPVVFLTAHDDPETLRSAGEVQPHGYVVKPFEVRELHATIETAIYRHRTEVRHGRMERWFATTLQSIGDGVLAIDLEGRVTFLNHRGEQLTGWSCEEAIGRPYAEVFNTVCERPEQETRDVFQQVVKDGVVINIANDYRLVTRDRREIPIDDSAAPIRDEQGRMDGVVLIFRDRWATKELEARQRRIEEKLRDTQRLESLGVLAGGIAHDFNNILTGIFGHASLAAVDLPPGSPIHESLHAIETAASRAADLCKQMLAYAGQGAVDVRRINVSTAVEDSAQLLRLSINKGVALKCELARDLPPVTADATQLHQIMMNLIMNASDAIGDKRGTITVTTGQTRVDRAYLAETYLGAGLPEDDYVFVEVADDGCGMDKATQRKIFDPFFTTKFTGRGLGLAAVLGIVRGHRGALKVYSEVGRGTTFKLLLPPVEGACEYQRSIASVSANWRGRGTILVVDDERVVRATIVPMLRLMGFDVQEACDGEEGLAAFGAHADSIVAVVLDLTMPRMDGVEAFRRIRKASEEIPIVLMSGFNEQEAVKQFVGKGLAGFLQKPFRFETLRDKLHGVLVARVD